MASNIASMRQFWQTFNLPQLQHELDQTATDLASRQDESDVSRRKLVEQSKQFKKTSTEETRKVVAPLLRSFQAEVDALSKRSKASESDFLNLYKKLTELPDPVPALEQVETYKKKSQRVNDVETENKKLRETLAEYNKEFADVKNQEVTIKNLRDRVKELEKASEDRAQQLVQGRNEILEKQYMEKEKQLQETQLLVATKLGEAEQQVVTLKAALDASQAELFDLKSKYDEDTAAKQSELDMLMLDVERASHRAEMREKEAEELRKQLAEHGNDSQQNMEQAIDMISRSSLEVELSAKEKEISQLVGDIQHLQASLSKLRDSSSSAIARIEQELSDKTAQCEELQSKMQLRSDYDEIKRELHILKSTEFATLNKDSDGSTTAYSTTNQSEAKSLEVLLLEKNRAQQSENSVLRASNAQLKGGNMHALAPSCEENITNDSMSENEIQRLQIQQQQHLNTLLSLNLLANLKAAVGSPNKSDQYFQSLYAAYGLDNSLIKRLYANTIGRHRETNHRFNSNFDTPEPSSPVSSSRTHSQNSEQSHPESSYQCNCRSNAHCSNHVPDKPTKRNDKTTWCRHGYQCYGDPHTMRTKHVDTIELTTKVKDLLQRHNIGQRAFGHFVLGLSQGSVSEILAKPKHWSKLTFKGREPFHRMMDFISSPTEVEKLKKLQRQDREERAILGHKQNTNRQEESNSNQVINKILAAAREEMKREKLEAEKQGISADSLRATYSSVQHKHKNLTKGSSPTTSSKDNSMTNFDSMEVTTSGASYPSTFGKVVTAGSSIICQPTDAGTGNTDTALATKEATFETSKTESERSEKTSSIVSSVNSLFNKSLVDGTSEIEGNSLYSCALSINENILNYHPSLPTKHAQHIYETRTYNDPFIPPPMSPASHESGIKLTTQTTSSVQYDNSPFLNEQQRNFDEKEKATAVTQSFSKNIKEEILDSSIHQDSGMFMQDQSLFRELSSTAPIDQEENSHFQDSDKSKQSISPNSSSSYVELHTVKTESFFNAQPSFSSASHGMSSMLTPLANESTTLQNSSTSKRDFENQLHTSNDLANIAAEGGIDTSAYGGIPLSLTAVSYVDTVALTKSVKDVLTKKGICQRIFGERVLGLSQGTVSDILSHPKDWTKLTHKGREPFARMVLWLSNTAGDEINSEQTQNIMKAATAELNQANNNLHIMEKPKEQAALSQDFPSSYGTKEVLKESLSPVSDSNTDSSSSSLLHNMADNFNNNASSAQTSRTQPGKKKNKKRDKFLDFASQEGIITPLQQMINIQELAASWPKLDTYSLTRRVKDLLTEHNIGQRIFGQAVLGLTQGSVSDLLSRPKVWHSLSLKGREPFVRMQLWLSDSKNIDQLKNLKLERWMEKKWVGKRRRCSANSAYSQEEVSPPVKKQRIKLTNHEKEVLRAAYIIEPYPSQETVDLLARKLTLKSSTIVNWFHNYRSRVKRGFFPSEKFNENISSVLKEHSNGAGVGKITVRELLDNIVINEPSSNQTNVPDKKQHEPTVWAPVDEYPMPPNHEIHMMNEAVLSEYSLDRLENVDVELKMSLAEKHLPPFHATTSNNHFHEATTTLYSNAVPHSYTPLEPHVAKSSLEMQADTSVYATTTPAESLSSFLPPVYTLTQHKIATSPNSCHQNNLSLPSASSLLHRSTSNMAVSPDHSHLPPAYMRSHSDSGALLCSNSNGNNNKIECNASVSPFVSFDNYQPGSYAVSVSANFEEPATTTAYDKIDTKMENDLYSWVF